MSKVIPALFLVLGLGLGFAVFRGAAGQVDDAGADRLSGHKRPPAAPSPIRAG